MKFLIGLILLLCLAGFGYLGYWFFIGDGSMGSPLEEIGQSASKIVEKPLEKYQLKRLRNVKFDSRQITFGDVVKEDDDTVSRMFYFEDVGASGDEKGKKVSGLINYPVEDGAYPVIVMFRGFVDQSIYTTGEGTRRTGEEIARNGFITLAPDFLGYGESEMPSEIPIEERFQTYTTAASLLAALPTLDKVFQKENPGISSDHSRVGIWAHSNGGQIALTTLGITGGDYPTVLWAPVTKSFPYNILYFTDEYDDEGKALRKVVSDFEKEYDVFDYSIPRYLSWIKAPLQIHQGTNDEAVPSRWSDQFVDLAKAKELDIEYFVYPGENHNFNLGSWSEAVSRTLDFYTNSFESVE